MVKPANTPTKPLQFSAGPPKVATIEAVVADITNLAVDAICNSAGVAMRGGGGVDGAIHKAAGPELTLACHKVAPCPVGEARSTWGFRLPARMVIHTSAPIWRGGKNGEYDLLEKCYKSALELADAHGAATIAFPLIGCGVRGFPLTDGVEAAIKAIRATLPECTYASRIIFACQDADVCRVVSNQIDAAGGEIRTAEYWTTDFEEIKVASRDYWFYIAGMSHHIWAICTERGSKTRIYFLSQHGYAHDWIDIKGDAAEVLKKNGFERWGSESEDASFIHLPDTRPYLFPGKKRSGTVSGNKNNWKSLSGKIWKS